MIFEWPWESSSWLEAAKTIGIFKQGKEDDTGNYRSISLSAVTGKIIEKIILEGAEKHLKYNAVIGHKQYGFTRGKSCLSNLISFYEEATYLVNQGNPLHVIFLDFSKVSDTVSHRISWTKCPAHGWISASCDGWAPGSWLGFRLDILWSYSLIPFAPGGMERRNIR